MLSVIETKIRKSKLTNGPRDVERRLLGLFLDVAVLVPTPRAVARGGGSGWWGGGCVGRRGGFGALAS